MQKRCGLVIGLIILVILLLVTIVYSAYTPDPGIGGIGGEGGLLEEHYKGTSILTMTGFVGCFRKDSLEENSAIYYGIPYYESKVFKDIPGIFGSEATTTSPFTSPWTTKPSITFPWNNNDPKSYMYETDPNALGIGGCYLFFAMPHEFWQKEEQVNVYGLDSVLSGFLVDKSYFMYKLNKGTQYGIGGPIGEAEFVTSPYTIEPYRKYDVMWDRTQNNCELYGGIWNDDMPEGMKCCGDDYLWVMNGVHNYVNNKEDYMEDVGDSCLYGYNKIIPTTMSSGASKIYSCPAPLDVDEKAYKIHKAYDKTIKDYKKDDAKKRLFVYHEQATDVGLWVNEGKFCTHYFDEGDKFEWLESYEAKEKPTLVYENNQLKLAPNYPDYLVDYYAPTLSPEVTSDNVTICNVFYKGTWTGNHCCGGVKPFTNQMFSYSFNDKGVDSTGTHNIVNADELAHYNFANKLSVSNKACFMGSAIEFGKPLNIFLKTGDNIDYVKEYYDNLSLYYMFRQGIKEAVEEIGHLTPGEYYSLKMDKVSEVAEIVANLGDINWCAVLGTCNLGLGSSGGTSSNDGSGISRTEKCEKAADCNTNDPCITYNCIDKKCKYENVSNCVDKTKQHDFSILSGTNIGLNNWIVNVSNKFNLQTLASSTELKNTMSDLAELTYHQFVAGLSEYAMDKTIQDMLVVLPEQIPLSLLNNYGEIHACSDKYKNRIEYLKENTNLYTPFIDAFNFNEETNKYNDLLTYDNYCKSYFYPMDPDNNIDEDTLVFCHTNATWLEVREGDDAGDEESPTPLGLIGGYPTGEKKVFSSVAPDSFKPLIKSGCCIQDSCWNGTQCLKPGATRTIKAKEGELDHIYVCRQGVWAESLPNTNWYYEYGSSNDPSTTPIEYCVEKWSCACPDENVYAGISDAEISSCKYYSTPGSKCTRDPYTYINDHFCEPVFDASKKSFDNTNILDDISNASWTTRTKHVALQLLKIAENSENSKQDYSLFCDHPKNALNYWELNGLKDVILKSKDINHFCALKLGNGETYLGVTLNPIIDYTKVPEYLYKDVEKVCSKDDECGEGFKCVKKGEESGKCTLGTTQQLLDLFYKVDLGLMLGSTGKTGLADNEYLFAEKYVKDLCKNALSSINTKDNPFGAFVVCENKNFSYNGKLNALIYLNNDLTSKITAVPYSYVIDNPLTKYAKKLMDIEEEKKTDIDEKINADMGIISRIADFSRFYLAKKGNKLVFGVLERKSNPRKIADYPDKVEYFIAVYYEGIFNNEINCSQINGAYSYAYCYYDTPKNYAFVTLPAFKNYYFAEEEKFNDEDNINKHWQDLTSRLRIKD